MRSFGGTSHLVHSHPFEGRLQELVVLDVLVFQLGTEFDFLQRHGVWEEHVHELAVRSACRNINQTLQSVTNCMLGKKRKEKKRLKVHHESTEQIEVMNRSHCKVTAQKTDISFFTLPYRTPQLFKNMFLLLHSHTEAEISFPR